MKTIELVQKDPDEARALLKTGCEGAPEDWPVTIEAPARIVNKATGKTVFVVDRYRGDMRRLRHSIMQYPMSTVLRATGTRNRSATFAYTSSREVMRRYSCRLCGTASEAPAAHDVLMKTGAELFDQLHETEPERAEADLALTYDRISGDWLIPGTPWTSGVVNDTSPLPYHMDANNLHTWNAMIVIRRAIEGGHLHVPEWGCTLDCRDGDVAFFPAYKTIHAVTPMRKTSADGYRFSAVYYTISAMQNCLPPEKDLARGRRQRTEAEDNMIERQRAAGLIE